MKSSNEPRSFSEGLEVLQAGGCLTRLDWEDPDIFILLRDDKLCIYGMEKDKLFHPLILSSADLFSTDWIVPDISLLSPSLLEDTDDDDGEPN